MSILGINSILYTSGDNYWEGEQKPSDELVTLINYINAKIEDDVLGESEAKLVSEMAGMKLEPSQEMRLRYFQAYLLRELYGRDFKQAYAMFCQALDIAEAHEDLDSQIVLADQLALMLYGLGKNYDAIIHYQIVLEAWQERQQQLAAPSIEPELHFRDRISVSQFAVGHLEEAAGTLSRVLTITTQQPSVPQSREVRLTIARALWTLGLIHCAQSDREDGSEMLLLRALMRFKQALVIFREVAEHEVNFGRLYLQVAETYLDLSYYYLQHAVYTKAGQARTKALAHALRAQSIPKYANDPVGQLMTELAMMRCEIMRQPDSTATRQMAAFDRALTKIERTAEKQNLPVIAGKAAALRGEWLLWRGDAPRARSVLFLALARLHTNNMGETTRVMRLLRRSNDEARAQRARRTRATGPRVRHPRQRP